MHVSVALLSFSFLVFYWLQGPPRVPRAYIMDALLVSGGAATILGTINIIFFFSV